jgi:DNA (cytosine-5)-methyltransferase 1
MVCPFRTLQSGERWPNAAFGSPGSTLTSEVDVSACPQAEPIDLRSFLAQPLRPLSRRATAGFYERALRGGLRFSDGFLFAMAEHLEEMSSG